MTQPRNTLHMYISSSLPALRSGPSLARGNENAVYVSTHLFLHSRLACLPPVVVDSGMTVQLDDRKAYLDHSRRKRLRCRRPKDRNHSRRRRRCLYPCQLSCSQQSYLDVRVARTERLVCCRRVTNVLSRYSSLLARNRLDCAYQEREVTGDQVGRNQAHGAGRPC
jgi:hypothetical protein